MGVIVHLAEQHLHAQRLYRFLDMESVKATAAALASDLHWGRTLSKTTGQYSTSEPAKACYKMKLLLIFLAVVAVTFALPNSALAFAKFIATQRTLVFQWGSKPGLTFQTECLQSWSDISIPSYRGHQPLSFCYQLWWYFREQQLGIFCHFAVSILDSGRVASEIFLEVNTISSYTLAVV